MSFFLTWIATAVGVGAAVAILPGIYPMGDNGTMAVVVTALMVALVNASIKPIAQLLSLPISVLTLGIFYLVVNGAMLLLASWLSATIFGSGVYVDGLMNAIFGSIIISLVGSIVNSLTGNEA